MHGQRGPAADTADRIVVWKFGGTSVADPARLRAAAERMVNAHLAGHQVVAVLSAMGQMTDDLLALSRQLSGRPPLRELDALLAVGEQVSCSLAAMAVHELGVPAVSLTGGQAGIGTDDRHGDARLHTLQPDRIRAAADTGAIVLVTGFQGVTRRGDVTTLGRGGSDASAVAIAAALGLGECEIYTDVAGVFTADPRVAPDARLIPVIGRDQMLQLAAAGAAVMQLRSLELAAIHDVDIHVRSSFTTEPGTWIVREDTMFETTTVTGVAHREHESLYTVHNLSPAAVSSALARRGVAIGSIVRHGADVQFTAPGADRTEVVAALTPAGAQIVVEDDLGSVTVVGTGVGRRPDVTARALLALERGGIDPRLVTSTPGRVAVHVAAPAVRPALRLLHELFALDDGSTTAPAVEHVDLAAVLPA